MGFISCNKWFMDLLGGTKVSETGSEIEVTTIESTVSESTTLTSEGITHNTRYCKVI